MKINTKNFINQLSTTLTTEQLIKLKNDIFNLENYYDEKVDLNELKHNLIHIKTNPYDNYHHLGICAALAENTNCAYPIMHLFRQAFCKYPDSEVFDSIIPHTKYIWRYKGFTYRIQYIDWIIKHIELILSL